MKYLGLIVCIFFLSSISRATDTVFVQADFETGIFYLDGAQFNSSNQVNLQPGNNVLILQGIGDGVQLAGLSHNIDNDATIMAQYLGSHLDKSNPKIKAKQTLQNQLESINAEIDQLNIEQQALLHELQLHQHLLNLDRLREMPDQSVWSSLSFAERKELERIYQDLKRISDQGGELSSDRIATNNSISQIDQALQQAAMVMIFEIYSPKGGAHQFSCQYYNAKGQWTPKYIANLPADDNKLSLKLKASVIHSNGADLSDAAIQFQNQSIKEKPKFSHAVAMNLKNNACYDYPKAIHKQADNPVSGIVVDEVDEAIIFATVTGLKNNRVVSSVTTDFDGKFRLPAKQYDEIKISYIGYEELTINNLSSSYVKATLYPAQNVLDAVEVVTYRTPLIDREESIRGARSERTTIYVDGVKVSGKSIAMQTVESAVSLKTLRQSYDLPKGVELANQDYEQHFIVDQQTIPVKLSFLSVPKHDEKAFLLAQLQQAENIIPADAEVYLNNQFLYTTHWDMKSIRDTLYLDLGVDPQIEVSRKRIYHKNSSGLGSKIKVDYHYEMAIHNQKSIPIELELEDVLPTAVDENISVSLIEESGAEIDVSSGVASWKLQFEPKEKKTITFRFEVKHPRYYQLYID